MKKTLSLVVMLFATSLLMAQNVEKSTITISNMQATAYVLSLDQDATMVKEAMAKKMKESSIKTKNVDGYTAALNYEVFEISADAINLYMKVEQKGKKGNKNTTVTFCAMPTSADIEQSKYDDGVQKYAEAFYPYIVKFVASKDLAQQEKVVSKAQKSYNTALTNQKKIEKNIATKQDKIAALQKDIEQYKQKIKDNEKAIANLQNEINDEQDKLKNAAKEIENSEQDLHNAQQEAAKIKEKIDN